jgi:hypothetical protein
MGRIGRHADDLSIASYVQNLLDTVSDQLCRNVSTNVLWLFALLPASWQLTFPVTDFSFLFKAFFCRCYRSVVLQQGTLLTLQQ